MVVSLPIVFLVILRKNDLLLVLVLRVIFGMIIVTQTFMSVVILVEYKC